MFAVIKYYEDGKRGIDRHESIYEIINLSTKRAKIVTRAEALKKVENEGLVRVLKNQFGVIWDTPNGDLKDLLLDKGEI